MGRDRVALFAAVREDHRRGLGIRAIARKHGVHRRMAREALASPVRAPRKVPERESPARDSVAPLIDVMLREDLDAPRKQRHTARRAWTRLRDEHDAGVSYSYVAKYVARRRPEIEAEARGQAETLEGYVPQAKEPGAEAEVDFGAVTVGLDGRDADCHLFAYRLSYSGLGMHRVYASCAQEALLEGHVTAFTVTGGVPRGHIRTAVRCAGISSQAIWLAARRRIHGRSGAGTSQCRFRPGPGHDAALGAAPPHDPPDLSGHRPWHGPWKLMPLPPASSSLAPSPHASAVS